MSILRDTLVSAFPKPPSGKVLTIDSKLSVASAHAVRRARAPPSKRPPHPHHSQATAILIVQTHDPCDPFDPFPV
mgnify:CR=1 FL=1